MKIFSCITDLRPSSLSTDSSAVHVHNKEPLNSFATHLYKIYHLLRVENYKKTNFKIQSCTIDFYKPYSDQYMSYLRQT